MPVKKSTKEQRDLFLAFAFASADLFLEIAEDGIIRYALGAAKSLTGIDYTELTGHNWVNIFTQKDRATLIGMRKRAQEGQRCGPLHVQMDAAFGNGQDAILTGIKMPGSGGFYVSVGFPSELMLKMASIVREQEEARLLDKDTFLHAATEAFQFARSIGEGAEMTLLDIPESSQIKEQLGNELWSQFTAAVTEILCANSIDGMAAAQIREGRYSVIHDPHIDTDTLRIQLEELGKETDPEGKGFEITGKPVTADLESLSERETTKALIYTINEFDRKGTSLNIESLNSGFKAYVSANAQKIHQFKTMVEQLNFDLEFQPLVDLEGLTLSHFEIISRFKAEGSTQEWIVFGEDIGMAADFDIAVTERVINYLLYKASTNRVKFAMNLSGQSIQNEQFFKTLLAKLELHKDLAQRMIFEITESTTITDFEMVNHFIKTLQGKGYKICLDDFGAGAASFQNIQQLHVDFVKMDGQYTRRILTSERDRVLVKNLGQMCKDLKIRIIAEQIEKEEQMEKMKELGIDMGQGYYFGYPQPKPEFDPDKIPAKAPPAKTPA